MTESVIVDAPKSKHIQYYTLEDIQTIQFCGFTCVLNKQVLQKIQTIADQVGSPEYVRTPQFPKKERKTPRRLSGRSSDLTEADWNAIRMFKATVIKKREGIDATIDRIRQSLNKMSDKTYTVLSTKIFNEMQVVMDENNDDSDECNKLLAMIGEEIFVIASSNLFYSALYAKFYKDLLQKVPSMRSIFDRNYLEFTKLFDNIETADPAKEYDKFCEINKSNEKRRAVAKFYINLMLHDILTCADIMRIILNIIKEITNRIDFDDVNMVDELVELLKIMVVDSRSIIVNSSDWHIVEEHMNSMLKMKSSEHLGLSNRSIFKYMDIQDILKMN